SSCDVLLRMRRQSYSVLTLPRRRMRKRTSQLLALVESGDVLLRIRRRGSVTTVILCLNAASSANAQEDVAAFYKGKQLRFVVGSAAGGGYDLFARIVARHIVEHIPGHPNVIVQNQPAAGGVVMTNQLYSQGPKDGTVVGIPINGIPTA